MVGHFDMCTILTIAFVFFCTTNVAARKVCYEGLDCFDTSLPCHVVPLPEKPSKINTEFYLFTPENPTTHEVIDWRKDGSIVSSKFQSSRDTKFIIHGYTENILLPQYVKMKDALLSIGKFNVILVNWKDGAEVDRDDLLRNLLKLPKDYLQARQNTRLVGRQIGELSRKLQKLKKASFSSMHLIGFSLGAHVAGYAGEHVSGQYGRITGLDPAGPLYRSFTPWKGCLLEKSDAVFVDIIHTDDVLGNQKAVGHQDFYPSGGKHQVSCPFLDFICDHERAVEFFTESINPKCE
ncbi:Pancreatic lipase-related protein 2 [Holothuria leucospilota]|uniref:Pancreatic lipase-related protein 2 n=1 Tax=Holothuria leucospilota TaxID=206669 RepID=A0A9Q0YU35_HOLLE|nr:Pancreatic lipase-related protein 2 [Holothuria leucospilota]